MKRVTVGDVVVHRGEPVGGNPYIGRSLLGEERQNALLLLCLGASEAEEFTYWHAPASGGARRIVDADEVAWSSVRGPEAEARAERQEAADRVEVKRALRRAGGAEELLEATRDVVKLWREGPLCSSVEFSRAMARLAKAVEP
jgi:hypothetical protein